MLPNDNGEESKTGEAPARTKSPEKHKKEPSQELKPKVTPIRHNP